MSSQKAFKDFFHVSENLVKHRFKAIYYRDGNGGIRLGRVLEFSTAKFTESGWETSGGNPPLATVPREADTAGNSERSARRARKLANDLIQNNPELHWFVTLTFSPDCVEDKSDFAECYRLLKVYLSNAVARRGLAYLGTVERTKAGDIHFHFLFNDGCDYVLSKNPHTGKPVEFNGELIYNVPGWRWGFTTAQDMNAGNADRDKAAAYVLKYITKDRPADTGGRYIYKGGRLLYPVEKCGDSLADFGAENAQPTFEKAVEGTCLVYREYIFGKP